MREIRLLGGFVLRFAVVFTLLVLPLPPLKHFLHAIFLIETRVLVKVVFPGKWVQVDSYPDPQHVSIDTKVTVGDPRDVRSDGQVPVKVIILDGRSLAWIPHAVWFSLCAATPMSWTRKVKMLLAGLLTVQVFIGVTLYNALLAGLIADFSPHWQQSLMQISNHLLIENLWVSFVVPLVFWCIWLGWQGDWRTILKYEQNTR